MKERVVCTCTTCQYFEPYHCTVAYHYIGYIDCEKPTKCRAYRRHENYKRGGKLLKEQEPPKEDEKND